MGALALLQLYVANVFWVVVTAYSTWKGRDRPRGTRLWHQGIYLGIFFWLSLNLFVRHAPSREVASVSLKLATAALVLFLFSIVRYNMPFVELKTQVSTSYFVTDFLAGVNLGLIFFTDHVKVIHVNDMWYDKISPLVYFTVIGFGIWAGYWVSAGLIAMRASNSQDTHEDVGEPWFRLVWVIFLVVIGVLILVNSFESQYQVGDTSAYFSFSILLGIFLTYHYSIRPMHSVVANQRIYEIIVSDNIGMPIYRSRFKTHLSAATSLISAGTHIVWTTLESFSDTSSFVKNLNVIFENRVLLSSRIGDTTLIVITERYNLQSKILFEMTELKLVELLAISNQTDVDIREEFGDYVMHIIREG